MAGKGSGRCHRGLSRHQSLRPIRISKAALANRLAPTADVPFDQVPDPGTPVSPIEAAEWPLVGYGLGTNPRVSPAQRMMGSSRGEHSARPCSNVTQRHSLCSGRPSSGRTGSVTASVDVWAM